MHRQEARATGRTFDDRWPHNLARIKSVVPFSSECLAKKQKDEKIFRALCRHLCFSAAHLRVFKDSDCDLKFFLFFRLIRVVAGG